MAFSKSTLLALLPFFLAATPSLAASTGKTTRYWDCCKPSCSWDGKATLSAGPVATCDKDDNPLADPNAVSACDGGSAYMCANESPWAVSDDLAYGYAAVSIAGGSESSWCCACYELTFTSGPVQGKKMIVQATNTGGDLGANHFDISIPGGGFGIFNGCTPQYGTPSTGWGEQYGGVSSRSMCDAFPDKLKAGCYWRYDWFANADNPSVEFEAVACPKALTAKSGCVRADDSPTGEVLTPTLGPAVGEAKPSTKAKVPTSTAVKAPVTSVAQAVPTVIVPEVDEPVVDAPVVDEPAVTTPAAAAPTVVAPVVSAPAVDEPVVDEPAVTAPAAAAPTVVAPVVSAPAVDEPVVDEPTVIAPVVDEPTVTAPAVDESTVTAPAADEPTATPVGVRTSSTAVHQAPPAVTSAAAASRDPVTGAVPLPATTVTESVVWCGAPSGSEVVAKYGQCGGKVYTGATVCAEGSVCKVSNEYYSQCV